MSVPKKNVPTPRNQNKRCSQVPNKSGLAIFKTITVCTENVAVAEAETDKRLRNIDSDNIDIMEDLVTQLTFLRGGPGLNYFLKYANSTNMTSLLKPNTSYTLLAPVDLAFQRWHPIDWGFNPFKVESFLQKLMRNFIIEDSIEVESSDTDKKYKTVGGKQIVITNKGENIYINNDTLVTGDLPLSGGKSQVIFIDRIPWMNDNFVEELRRNNRWVHNI